MVSLSSYCERALNSSSSTFARKKESEWEARTTKKECELYIVQYTAYKSPGLFADKGNSNTMHHQAQKVKALVMVVDGAWWRWKWWRLKMNEECARVTDYESMLCACFKCVCCELFVSSWYETIARADRIRQTKRRGRRQRRRRRQNLFFCRVTYVFRQ